MEVTAALDHLALLCRRSTSSGEERVAGWMIMGPEEKIKVSLLGPKDPITGGDKESGNGFSLNGTEGVLSERWVGRRRL